MVEVKDGGGSSMNESLMIQKWISEGKITKEHI